MRSRSGSALILVLMLTVAATTIVLGLTGFAASLSRDASRREADAKLKYAFEGAVAQIQSGIGRRTIAAPATVSLTVGGVPWKLTIKDTSVGSKTSYSIEGEATFRDRAAARSAVTGNPYLKGPWHFALSSGTSVSTTQNVITGPAGQGHVHVKGTFTSSGLSTNIQGDLLVTEALAPIAATVSGEKITDAVPIVDGTLDTSLYQSNAAIVLSSGTWSNPTFGTAYQLAYRSGNLKVSGTISGTGTVFVDGDLEITGNASYANASSGVLFIAAGKITFASATSSVVGNYYAFGGVEVLRAGGLTVVSGTIFARDGYTLSGPLTITLDQRIKNSQLVGESYKSPGYWP